MININNNVNLESLNWQNLSVSINNKKILSKLSGEVRAGELCCIIGSSGAGKTSLLNILAGRSGYSSKFNIVGNVGINNKVIDPLTFRNNIAYVMQDNALFATLTPKEVLRFSAKLRLPKETTRQEIHGKVYNIIKTLHLRDCQDTYIGSILTKGISGGEKKRTSIGIELITEPKIIFLDEPTSGLDSFAAYNVVKSLRVIKSERIILCTIHQPSSEVFYLFDRVIVLNNGKILYNGGIEESYNYFRDLGFPCPDNYNMADHILFVCQTVSSKIIDNYSNIWGRNELKRIKIEGKYDIREIEIETRSEWWRQLFLLTVREFRNLLRDKVVLKSRFGIIIFLITLYTLVYKGVGNLNNSEYDLQSHFGLVTQISITTMFSFAQPIILTFPIERPVFLRERSVGTYKTYIYFISKFLIELPLTLFLTILIYLIIYWSADLNGNFVSLVLVTWLESIVTGSMSILIGCTVNNFTTALQLMPAIYVPQILFSGFFIKIELIPFYLRWIQYICFLKYSLNALMIVELDGSPGSEELFKLNDVDKDLFWLYILILIGLVIGYRLIAVFFLSKKVKDVQ